MTPRRRLTVVAALVLASLGGSTLAAHADLGDVDAPHTSSTSENRDWVCAYVEPANNAGACLSNPLPKRLPIPEDLPGS